MLASFWIEIIHTTSHVVRNTDLLEGVVHIHHGFFVICFDVTNEGCVSALGLRNQFVTATFAGNLRLCFHGRDFSKECARHILIIEGGHGGSCHDVL